MNLSSPFLHTRDQVVQMRQKIREICTRFPKHYSHGSYKYWIIVRCNSALYVIIASIIVRDAITIHFVRTIFFEFRFLLDYNLTARELDLNRVGATPA